MSYALNFQTKCVSFKRIQLGQLTLFFFFATQHGLRDMRDLSSLTRGGTRAPCSGSADSQPLDCQGSPS